jgi:hypothetical protein
VVIGGKVGKEVGGVFKIDWKRKTFWCMCDLWNGELECWCETLCTLFIYLSSWHVVGNNFILLFGFMVAKGQTTFD